MRPERALSARRSETSASDRNFGLSHVGFEYRRLFLKNICAERLNVKLNRRTHIREGIVVGITLSYDHTAQSDRIRHIAVVVFLNDDLDRLHGVSIALPYRRPPMNARYSSAVPSPHAPLTISPTTSSLPGLPVIGMWRSGAITNAATSVGSTAPKIVATR